MIQILILDKNDYLDLYASTVLTLNRRTTAYMGDDPEALPGSYSFPITIPLTPRNKILTGTPGRIDQAASLMKNAEIMVYFNGAPFLPGRASIRKPTHRDAQLNITLVDFPEIKDTPLNQIDLEGDRDIGATLADRLEHARLTSTNPHEYPYIFFPIWNPRFHSSLVDFDGDRIYSHFTGEHQNYWDGINFVSHPEQQAAMPFVKVDYLLSRIFGATRYSFENLFQTTEELRRLCLYNNFSIYDNLEWGRYINLQNHVSDTPAGTFAKRLIRLFCLMPVVNEFDSTVKLRPLRDIINDPTVKDWTDRKVVGFAYDEDNNYPGTFKYAPDDRDELTKIYDELWFGDFLEKIKKEDVSIPPDPNGGQYYIYSRNWMYTGFNTGPGEEFIPLGLRYPQVTIDPEAETFESQLTHIQTVVRSSPTPPFNEAIHPAIFAPGTIRHQQFNNPFTDRLIFYRGTHPLEGDFDYPFASAHVYDDAENQIGDYSLLWNGDHGIYEQWWKDWHYHLTQKKDVTMDLLLDLADLSLFSFDEKIRVGNQNYFVKSMQITLTMKGIAPTKLELITTV